MAASLVLAAAQSASMAGDIKLNVARHLRFASVAAARGVDLLVFPELSLTGYELATAVRDAMLPEDARLRPLREAAVTSGLTIVAGAPLRAVDGLHLGALVFRPDGTVMTYAKIHLHEGEDAVFRPGARHVSCAVRDTVMVPAICADIGQPSHPETAAGLGAGIYAAGVLVTDAAIAAEAGMLEGYARQFGMAVVMANHAAPSGGWVPAGRSAIWSADGRRVADLPGAGEAMLVADAKGGVWTGEVLRL